MKPKTAAASVILALYFSAGGLCLSEPEPRPWGAPTPEAKWTIPVERDDPRPFWLRLLTSLRWDFVNKDIRGGATF
jgi:hypothetical protein